MKHHDGLKLIEDYNVDKLSFEWGGVDYISFNRLAQYLNLLPFDLRQITDELDEEFQEYADFFIMDSDDLEAVTGERYTEETEVCYSKPAVASILTQLAFNKLNELFPNTRDGQKGLPVQ